MVFQLKIDCLCDSPEDEHSEKEGWHEREGERKRRKEKQRERRVTETKRQTQQHGVILNSERGSQIDASTKKL